MPCSVCNCTLIRYCDEFLCPRCRNLAILDSDSAIRVTERVLDQIKQSFNNELSTWQVDYLVANLSAKREIIARDYFKEYSSAPIGEIANLTLLISKCLEICTQNGKITDNKQEITDLFNNFKLVNDYESTLLGLKSCYNNVLCLYTFNNQNLTIDQLLKNIIIVPNENYENLKNTFALHDIYTEKEAKEKLEQFKKETKLDRKQNNIEYVLLPTHEFIKKYFPLLNSMYVLFMQDYNYMHIFERLKQFRELLTDPRSIITFVSSFKKLEGDVITVCRTEDFMKRATMFFNTSREKVETNLIYGQFNKSSFPLFNRVHIPALGGDVIIISPDFSRFIYTVLHVYIAESSFNKETEKRSIDFEKKQVKESFERLGYTYYANVKIKNKFEIDGVAIKKSKCFVIECKGWRLPHLIYEKRKRDEVIRDLAGIVKGEKFTKKSCGKLKIEKRPSIIQKMDYVKKNFSNLFKTNNSPEIQGLIIIPDYPPISSIEGIKILSVAQLRDLK